jgi:hypothetical protein
MFGVGIDLQRLIYFVLKILLEAGSVCKGVFFFATAITLQWFIR